MRILLKWQQSLASLNSSFIRLGKCQHETHPIDILMITSSNFSWKQDLSRIDADYIGNNKNQLWDFVGKTSQFFKTRVSSWMVYPSPHKEGQLKAIPQEQKNDQEWIKL